MKRFVMIASGILIVLGFMLGAIIPAFAQGTIVDCLQEGTAVCMMENVSINDAEAVAEEVQGLVQVAVVDAKSVEVISANQLANNLASNAGSDELIVVVDMQQDRFGAYSKSGNGTALLESLYSTGKSDGGDAIMNANIAQVLHSSPLPPVETGDSGGGWFVGLGTVVGLATVIAVGATLVNRRYSTKRKKDPLASLNKLNVNSLKVSNELKNSLQTLIESGNDFVVSSRKDLNRAGNSINSIVNHLNELFKRLNRKGHEQNKRLAEVKYLEITNKLNQALGRDYFIDLVYNPNLWDDSEFKVNQIYATLDAVDNQIVSNIRQVNASKELEFKIALDSMRELEAPSVGKAYGK